jgi:hypothetical protein
VIGPRIAGWLLIVVVAAMPGAAWACPFCAAGRQSPGVSALIMSIMVLPFLLVGIVLRAVLRVRNDSGESTLSPSLEER